MAALHRPTQHRTRGAQEDEVGAQHGFDQGQRDGGRLVDDQQLGLGQPRVVLRLDVLHGLAVVAVHIDAHYGAAKGGVGALHQVVVDVLL